jgi:RNA polymerase sigma factor (sigma-70 family)
MGVNTGRQEAVRDETRTPVVTQLSRASNPGERLLSDAEIIGVSLREPSAFSALFDRHAEEIARYVSARVGPDLADDVIAETFLAAFRHRERYDMDRPDARPWLYGIAVRQIGSHRRAEARYRKLTASALPDADTQDFGDRAAERVTAEQLRPALVAVLGKLRRQDRELLLLVAWAGLSYDECAQALGLTVSAVKSRLNRIRIRTRNALGGANPMNAEETHE